MRARLRRWLFDVPCLTAIFIAAALLLSLGGCTRPDSARATLEANGFRDIELKGYAPFACGRDDAFATAFEATAPSGRRVRGAICGGLLKGDTLRLTSVVR